MKLFTLKGALLGLGMIAFGISSNAQIAYFTGDLAPGNWTLFSVGASSDAEIDSSGAPYTIIFNGNNSSAGDFGTLYDEWEMTAPFDGCVSFDYTWDNPDIEDFGYVIDGAYTPVETGWGTVTGNVNVTLTAGQTFAVRITTFDDCCGMGVLQMDNFGFHEDLGDGVPPADPMPDIVAACGIALDLPIGYDCEGNMVPTTSDPLTYDTPGTYTVTWEWVDAGGLVITLPQNIIIEDNEAPVPDADPLPVIASCNADLTALAPTATDACGGGIAVTGTTTDPLFYDEDGFYSVTWTYDDGAGNISTQTQDIIISNPVKGSGVVTHATGAGTGSIDVTVDGSFLPPLEFDWDNDGTGDFDDTEDLTGLDAGTYTVTIRDALGCEDIETFTVLDQLSVEELAVYFEIFPNPTSGMFQVQTNNLDFMGQNLMVTNAVGQIIYNTTIDNQTTEIDLGQFEDGIYFITVGENNQSIGRIVKQ